MKTVELFCGTKSFSKIARDRIRLLETRDKYGIMVSRNQLMRIIDEMEKVGL